jgi:hypothetical protein
LVSKLDYPLTLFPEPLPLENLFIDLIEAIEILDHQRISELDALLYSNEMMEVQMPDFMQGARKEKSREVALSLQLRVDYQGVFQRRVDYYRVLNGQLVVGKLVV